MPDRSAALAVLDKIEASLSDLSRRMDRLEAAPPRARPRDARDETGFKAENRPRVDPAAAEAAMLHSLQTKRDALIESTKPLSRQEEEDNKSAQVRADSVYRHVHRRAPAPSAFERPNTYRRRLLKELSHYSSIPDFKAFNWRLIPDAAIDNFERQMFDDILSRADAILADCPKDSSLIKREEVDSYSGQRRVKYFGHDTFIKNMSIPRRCVLKKPEEFASWRGY